MRKLLVNVVGSGAVLVLGWQGDFIATADVFTFGNDQNDLHDIAMATLIGSEFELQLTAGPAGALFHELGSAGLGINSRGIDGASDGEIDKLSLIGGAADVTGQGEWVEFSLDRPGILNGLQFDGLKDETLEYLTLRLPDGTQLTLFDSQTQLRLIDQSFELADLGVPNPRVAPDESDDFPELNLAFSAGEVFRLTYGEIDFENVLPGYIPLDGVIGNGARWMGIEITTVPEPASAIMAAMLAVVGLLVGRPRR